MRSSSSRAPLSRIALTSVVARSLTTSIALAADGRRDCTPTASTARSGLTSTLADPVTVTVLHHTFSAHPPECFMPTARIGSPGSLFEGSSSMRTYTPKASEIQREWHVVDADGLVLGRMCTEIARILRGKHKPIFAPHLDTGDHVVVVNASKVVLTSAKADRERVWRHSGYPGGIKSESYGELLARKPADAIRHSVKGMLPKGPLGRQMLNKLKVYAGPDHPHAAQSPEPLDLSAARAR